MTPARLSLALGLSLAACWVPPPTVTVRVELPLELGSDVEQLTVHPRIAEVARESNRGVVALRLRRGPLRLELPGACPVRLDTSQTQRSAVEKIRLRPLFDPGPSERVVGLGQSFTIKAEPNCAEARAARVSIAVTGGAGLEQVQLSTDGRVLTARTGSAPPLHGDALGIVPVSAAEQRRFRSELTLRVELDGQKSQQALGVSAVARSSGLPNVGLMHPVLLSGRDWRLEHKPETSQALLRLAGSLSELVPDVPGRYRLRDSRGHELSVQSGRFDQTPLDCGRGDCHAEVTRAAAKSPMTQALASDLGGCHSLEKPECAIACHTTGEPGTLDGGFQHVAATLGLPALPEQYEDLPAPLRRLGGVGCMACHGTAAIPEPSARWAILRSDVCAVCHDAPPRYGHAQAFRTSRMAHADRHPMVRENAACARCHTSWGALGRPAPPSDVAGFGLTCATCHAVHAPADGAPATGHGLLRAFALPPALSTPPPSFSGPSRVCISCHAPSSTTSAPEASAALLVAGQGGFDPATGASLTVAAPHAESPRGCLACHDTGPEELVLGKSHGFRSSRAACARCHERAPERDPSIAARARSLLERWAKAAPKTGRAPHASTPMTANTPEQARALYDVLLVVEDPAADVHHPSYAKALLDAAQGFAPKGSP